MFVYVVNRHGRPLMPCRPRKARILLQSGKAKVIRRTPFTIQLIYGSSGYVQPVSLGVDAGSKVLGISATTERTVLFEYEDSGFMLNIHAPKNLKTGDGKASAVAVCKIVRVNEEG